MIDSKIAWHREKIEKQKELRALKAHEIDLIDVRVQYHENEIKRLGGNNNV